MSQMQQTKSNIIYCTRENQINKLIKDQKFSKKRSYFLFISLWDEVSSNLLKELEQNPPSFSVYVVNSFDTPHSFVIWDVKSTPTLVVLESGARKITTTNHVTDIYKRLKLEK